MHWDLTALIIGALLFFAGYRIGFSRGRRPPSTFQTSPRQIDISDEHILAALRADRKIEAIKLYRQRHGAGLKQAKEAVEAIEAGIGHARSAD